MQVEHTADTDIAVLSSSAVELYHVQLNSTMCLISGNVGLFVPLHFRSREQKVHRWNFHSRGTFVPWNIRSLELLLLWNFRSSGANVPRTFIPSERIFQELSLQSSKTQNDLKLYPNHSSFHRTRHLYEIPTRSPPVGQ